MATVVVGCVCMQRTIVEGTGIVQIQPKSGLLPEAFFWLLTCYHGKRTNWVQCCAKLNTHTDSHG